MAGLVAEITHQRCLGVLIVCCHGEVVTAACARFRLVVVVGRLQHLANVAPCDCARLLIDLFANLPDVILVGISRQGSEEAGDGELEDEPVLAVVDASQVLLERREVLGGIATFFHHRVDERGDVDAVLGDHVAACSVLERLP